MNRLLPLTVILLALAAVRTAAEDQPKLDPHLEPLRPFLEKTWKSEFKNSTPEKPLIDVVRWERALNGKAIRTIHSLNNGAYGGESIIRWDAAKNSIVYHYFTTANFMTVGTMTIKDNVMTCVEEVVGNAGVTQVRSTWEMPKDGKYSLKSEHLKDGNWVPAREAVYTEAPDAKIVFK